MILSLVIVYSVLLFILSYRKWDWSLGWLVIILPSYLIRFQIWKLPSTLLEVSFGVIFLVWLIKYFGKDKKEILDFFRREKIFFCSLIIFFLASILAIFISGAWFKGLGIWRAYFLEPILFFIMLVGRRKELSLESFRLPVFISSVIVAVLAVGQKILNFPVAPSLWNDDLGERATSFFTSPNALGMFLAPMIVLILGYIYLSIKNNTKKGVVLWVLMFGVIIDLLAVLLSYSRGAWLALAICITITVLLLGYRRVGLVLVVAGICMIVLIPTVRTHVFFQDKASQNRLILWLDSWNYLSESPSNFIFGTGLRQFFNKIERPHYNPKIIEPLTYPHNIFLNFWTEIGLFGMLGFVGVLSAVGIWCYKLLKKNMLVGSVCIGVLLTILIQGLVDVPYFKNDLAFIFWIFVFITYQQYFISTKK